MRTTVPPCLLPAITSNNDSKPLQLDREGLDRFSRFHTRTILTIGTTQVSELYQKTMIELAFSVRMYIDLSDIWTDIT